MPPGTLRISRPANGPLNPAIPDEAHRSQNGIGGKVNEKTGAMSYGFASNLRDALLNASFIGFTGTPIEKGSNDKARRADRHETLIEVVQPFLKEKK